MKLDVESKFTVGELQALSSALDAAHRAFQVLRTSDRDHYELLSHALRGVPEGATRLEGLRYAWWQLEGLADVGHEHSGCGHAHGAPHEPVLRLKNRLGVPTTALEALKQRDQLRGFLLHHRSELYESALEHSYEYPGPVAEPRLPRTPEELEFFWFTLQFLSLGFERMRIVLWEPEIYNAAIRGSEAFANQKIPEPYPDSIWFFTRRVFIGAGPVGEVPSRPRGAERLIAYGLFSTGGLDVAVEGPFWSATFTEHEECLRLRVNPTANDRAEILPDSANAFAAHAFLGLEIHQESVTPALPRHERRRLKHANRVPPEIRVVSLRRIVSDGQRAGSSEAETREWSCRWLVRWHWRNQWHPATKSHKPVFIHEYVKGPKDKPLRLPSKVVAIARR